MATLQSTRRPTLQSTGMGCGASTAAPVEERRTKAPDKVTNEVPVHDAQASVFVAAPLAPAKAEETRKVQFMPTGSCEPSGVCAERDRAPERGSAQETFDLLDADGNGQLSLQEIRPKLRDAVGLTSSETVRFFNLLDTNQDGIVDRQEFAAAFDKWQMVERGDSSRLRTWLKPALSSGGALARKVVDSRITRVPFHAPPHACCMTFTPPPPPDCRNHCRLRVRSSAAPRLRTRSA